LLQCFRFCKCRSYFNRAKKAKAEPIRQEEIGGLLIKLRDLDRKSKFFSHS